MTLASFGPLVFTLPTLPNYLTFHFIDFKRTWWMLF